MQFLVFLSSNTLTSMAIHWWYQAEFRVHFYKYAISIQLINFSRENELSSSSLKPFLFIVMGILILGRHIDLPRTIGSLNT